MQMRKLVNAMFVLMAGAVFADTVPVTAPEEMRKIPFIYCSDIFHPAVDPDDHFDLAAVFRLKELDIKAVILDGHNIRPNQDQLTGGGQAPLEQMMDICGYKVPYAIGLKRKLLDPKDKALDEDPRHLADRRSNRVHPRHVRTAAAARKAEHVVAANPCARGGAARLQAR